MDMEQLLGHELRADGNVIPKRPTMQEADYHPEIWAKFMQQWATDAQMRNRVAPPDAFLDNVNEHMRLSKYDEMFMGYVNGEMTYDELMRRILESGG